MRYWQNIIKMYVFAWFFNFMHIFAFCRSIWNVRQLQHIISFDIRCPWVLFLSIIGFTCEKQIESSSTKIESSNYVSILDICSVQGSALKDELCELPGLTIKKEQSVWAFFLPLQLAAGQYYSKLRNLKCYWLQHFFFLSSSLTDILEQGYWYLKRVF